MGGVARARAGRVRHRRARGRRSRGDPLHLGHHGTAEGRRSLPREPRQQRPRGRQPLRARPRAVEPRRPAALALVRTRDAERRQHPRHEVGAAALVQSRGGAGRDRALPRPEHGRRAHDVRLPPQLSRRGSLRHLVDALVGLGRRRPALGDRGAVREEVRRAAARGLRPHRGLAGGEHDPPVGGAQARLGGPADSRRRGHDPRRRGSRAARGRDGRDRRAGPERDGRLLRAARGDGTRAAQRLAAHGRRRPAGCRRLPLRGRAEEGPHHPRRLQHLSARGGGGALRPPRRRGGGRGGDARSADGRRGVRIRGAEGRRRR